MDACFNGQKNPAVAKAPHLREQGDDFLSRGDQKPPLGAVFEFCFVLVSFGWARQVRDDKRINVFDIRCPKNSDAQYLGHRMSSY